MGRVVGEAAVDKALAVHKLCEYLRSEFRNFILKYSFLN